MSTNHFEKNLSESRRILLKADGDEFQLKNELKEM